MSTTPETPTPETDAFKRTVGTVWHDFAERLERERDAARAENAVMREAITSSYHMLKYFERFTPNLVALTEQQWLNTQEGKNTMSALTKLKPFITDAPHPQP